MIDWLCLVDMVCLRGQLGKRLFGCCNIDRVRRHQLYPIKWFIQMPSIKNNSSPRLLTFSRPLYTTTQATKVSLKQAAWALVYLFAIGITPDCPDNEIGDLLRLIKLSHIRKAIDLLRDEQRKLQPGQWRLTRRQETNFQHKYFFYLLIYWYCHINSNSTTVQLTFCVSSYVMRIVFQKVSSPLCWKMLQYMNISTSH